MNRVENQRQGEMGGAKLVELLAPAGNFEALKGAVNAGADAVYLGGTKYGARAYADNFSEEELIFGIRFAHLYGKKIYLTVNTLAKEKELEGLYEFLKPFYLAGLDGVIVQDIGVLSYIREHFPGLELHASTQMTLTGVYGASLMKKMGVCRIVPARELSLREIKEIKKSTGLQIEAFIHGAMCYCYSGQCLFSSILGGRSGNRGRCAQPCRLAYTVTVDGKKTLQGYPLSLKDMATLPNIPELIEAGIDSFKIEGRMKKPEYAAGVTAIYRKYIDRYYEICKNGGSFEIEPEDMKTLSKLYIRSEIQDGYYHRYHGKDMVTVISPAYSRTDEELLAGIRDRYIDRTKKIPVRMEAFFMTDEPAVLKLGSRGMEVCVKGNPVLHAASHPMDHENVKSKLSRLGDTWFEAQEILIQSGEDAFYPVGGINELRRRAVWELERRIREANGFPDREENNQKCITVGNLSRDREHSGHIVSVSVRRMEQLEEILKKDFFQRIYVNGDIAVYNDENFRRLLCRMSERGIETVVSLPYELRERDEEYLEKLWSFLCRNGDKVQGVQVRSIDGLGYLLAQGYRGNIYTDAGFYVWNTAAWREWKRIADLKGFCLPYELSAGEQIPLTDTGSFEKVVYGRIPMMITANCIVQTSADCLQKGDRQWDGIQVSLTDRYQVTFPVEADCHHCMNIIYNSVPLSLHKNVTKYLKKLDIRLDFTTETPKECEAVLRYFEGRIQGDEDGKNPPYKEYTTGHERRGVE